MEYVAIIGDIIASKEVQERGHIQEKLRYVLNQINSMYIDNISAKFIITLGDEFQGLLKDGRNLLDIIKYIQREMYPVRLRFGIGIGEISTEIFHEAALGADGPAYYAARDAMEELREQERKFRKQAADIYISKYNAVCLEMKEINTMLSLIKVIENKWSDAQRYTIWDMEENGDSQETCAKRMNTTQSTVARRLADGNFITYQRAKTTLKEALSRLGETEKHD